MKCIIAANGALTPSEKIISQINSADMIIAADGGAVHLHHMNIIPDIIIGDLDSISPDTRHFYQSKKVPMVTHPARKDQTDTELCIDHALENGCTEIVFIGVTGHRLDHTLANIFLLRPLVDLNVKARIIDAHNEIYLVLSHLTIHGEPGDLISVIPVSEKVTGLTLTGMDYPLTDKTMRMGTALGVSNCFTDTRAEIHIDSGIVLVVLSRE